MLHYYIIMSEITFAEPKDTAFTEATDYLIDSHVSEPHNP